MQDLIKKINEFYSKQEMLINETLVCQMNLLFNFMDKAREKGAEYLYLGIEQEEYVFVNKIFYYIGNKKTSINDDDLIKSLNVNTSINEYDKKFIEKLINISYEECNLDFISTALDMEPVDFKGIIVSEDSIGLETSIQNIDLIRNKILSDLNLTIDINNKIIGKKIKPK